MMDKIAPVTEQDLLAKTGMLIEALPYMRRYSKQMILIKFGGHAMSKLICQCFCCRYCPS